MRQMGDNGQPQGWLGGPAMQALLNIKHEKGLRRMMDDLAANGLVVSTGHGKYQVTQKAINENSLTCQRCSTSCLKGGLTLPKNVATIRTEACPLTFWARTSLCPSAVRIGAGFAEIVDFIAEFDC